MIRKDSHLSDQDLLLAADGELSAHRDGQVRRHLQACWACRKRMTDLEINISDFVSEYQSAFNPPTEDGLQAMLRRRLTAASAQPAPSRWPIWRWRLAASFALLAVFVLAGTFWAWRHRQTLIAEAGVIPNSTLTPGEVATVSRGQVCQAQALGESTKVPDNLRDAVFSIYGMKDAPRDAYEVDFLITPELGGSASIKNLWPEPYNRRAWNAHVKDELEDRLHALVCSGDLDLATAQHEIASNWVSAYKKYVGTNRPI